MLKQYFQYVHAGIVKILESLLDNSIINEGVTRKISWW